MITPEIILKFYIVVSIQNSLIAFFAYSNDKSKAMHGSERIPEKSLLFLSVFFGSVGAVIGRIVARHKTDKVYFSIVIYFSLLVQAATMIALVLLK